MDPPLRQSTPRWGLGDAALGILVGLMLSAGAGSVWLGATGDTELPLGGQALSQIGLWTGLVGAAVWASRRKGSGHLADDFGLRMRPVDMIVGLVLGVVCQYGLVNLIAFLLSPLIGHPDVAGPVTDLVRESRGPELVGVVLFTVVGAPLVEELFYRGLVLRSLQRRLAGVAAIAVSAVLFGASHLQPLSIEGLVLVITSLIAFGAVLSFITVRSGRLGPAIWTHAVFNAFTVVVLLT